MSKIKSLKDLYKFEKWDLYFGEEKINKCKGTFVLYVVNNSLTFESWIKEEVINETFTNGFFKCVWRDSNVKKN